MVKRYVYVCLMAMLITSLAFGSEVRKLTMEDMEWNGTPVYGSETVTSAGGHVGHPFPAIPYIDVRAFGAECDGTTDDAVAVQNALDNITTGTLLIPDTCAIGSAGWVGLTIASKSNITIKGSGENAGIKFLAEPSQEMANFVGLYYTGIKITSGSNIHIVGIKFDSNSLNVNPIGWDSCSYCVIESNVFTGTEADVPAVLSTAGVRNKYINNIVYDSGRGFWIGHTSSGDIEEGALISGNHIDNVVSTAIGGTFKNTVISNNVVDTVTTAPSASCISLGSANSEINSNNTISGNTLRNCAAQGIQSDVTGTAYTKGVSVIGNVIENSDNYGIYAVNCMDWTIVGNTIINSNHDGVLTGGGIALYNTWNTIVSSNIVYDNQAVPTTTYGIFADASNTINSIDNVQIIGNKVRGTTQYGILFTRASTGTGKNILIIGNESTSNTEDGIAIFSSGAYTNVIVSNNISTNNGGWGYYNQNGRGVTGSNNVGSSNTSGNFAYPIGYLIGDTWYGVGTAAPTDNIVAYAVGDTVYNTANDNVIGWKNTVAGAPGTWKSMTITLEP